VIYEVRKYKGNYHSLQFRNIHYEQVAWWYWAVSMRTAVGRHT